jgi:hypothetical protein
MHRGMPQRISMDLVAEITSAITLLDLETN